MAGEGWRGLKLYTVGHSTRALDELVQVVRSFAVRTVVDVRTIPRSRHNPQFNADTLPRELAKHDLGYSHIPRLGGLRRPARHSVNGGWRNASFRGFADYMSTSEFELGLAELHELALQGCVSIMCAEAVPWRCHRSLIADALLVRGARIEHIQSAGRASPHRMTPFVHVRGEQVTYPSTQQEQAAQ